MLSPNRFAFPSKGWRARAANLLANSHNLRRVRRSLMGLLPFPVLNSEVRDVVYANWLVSVSALAKILPPGIKLIERNGQTLLTVLSYRHGHFGPKLFGPFRKVFPSPLQSNWRVYIESVRGEPTAVPTVYFLSNIFDSALYALTTRLLSDSLPSHLASIFEHGSVGQTYRTMIDGGDGSAPSFLLEARATEQSGLNADFSEWFTDLESAYAQICLQDAAICIVDDIAKLAEATIDLPIKINEIQALDVVTCCPGELLTALGADNTPWCFHVPAVNFAVTSERILN